MSAIDALRFLIFWLLAIDTSHRCNGEYHECVRDCVEGVTMLCHYTFMLEHFVTKGRSCHYCNGSATRLQLARVPDCQCAYGDGFERGVLTINRMIPGPSIQVCRGDTIVVDVENGMSGLDTALHWHGLHQNGSQYYDGVPFVTQCPIHGGNRFRYKFRADKAGTHFYHSHSSVQKLDGLYGSLIVRVPRMQDPHSILYKHDLPEHTIVISDFLHSSASDHIPGFTEHDPGQYPATLLINGRGRFLDRRINRETRNPYEEIFVEPGQRYRLRLVNSLGTTCDARFTIEQHPLTIVSTDGDDVVPILVDSLVSYSGERYDVVISTKSGMRARSSYWIQVLSEDCYANQVHQIGILRYVGATGNKEPTSPKPTYTRALPSGKIYRNTCFSFSPLDRGAVNDDDDYNELCIMDLRSQFATDREILQPAPDLSLYLPYELLFYKGREPFLLNTYKHFLVPPSTRPFTGLIDGISFVTPSVPPLSQPEDLDPTVVCNSRYNLPRECTSKSNCTCVHTVAVPLNHVVEIILVDRSVNLNTTLPHPFHLHGHSFRVIACGQLPEDSGSVEQHVAFLLEESRRLLVDAWKLDPPIKDTIVIPHRGYAILRVKMNNPGYWFFHCHFAYHIVIGMNMIFRVGDQFDLPELPKNFPRCGDFSIPD